MEITKAAAIAAAGRISFGIRGGPVYVYNTRVQDGQERNDPGFRLNADGLPQYNQIQKTNESAVCEG